MPFKSQNGLMTVEIFQNIKISREKESILGKKIAFQRKYYQPLHAIDRCRPACLLLLLPDPFRAMGVWRKTMELQKPGNCPGSGPEVVGRQRVAKK